MEDGSNRNLSDDKQIESSRNGVVFPTMANFPDGVIEAPKDDKVNHTENSKVNGDNVTETNEESNLFEEDSYSSESDALIIDESIPKRQKSSKRKNAEKSKIVNEENSIKGDLQDNEIVTHSNPYFNESLFELSQLHHSSPEENVDTKELTSTPAEIKDDKLNKVKTKKARGKAKPKLREYAQYLGLQPTVQFKCSKCGRAGFESLTTLHDHVVQCNSGMFSVLEDLCQHIQSRHNLEPGHKDTLDEFFNVYNEPCYVVCCECNKLFSEQDNFFYHNCVGNKNKGKKMVKQQITPENHVTGDSVHITSEMSTSAVNKNSPNIHIETSESKQNMDNTHNIAVSMETADVDKDLTITDKVNELSHQEINKNLESHLYKDEKSTTNINLGDNQEEITHFANTENISNEVSMEDLMEDNPNDDIDEKGDKTVEENVAGEDNMETVNPESVPTPEPIETRKVPKLSLKLPKLSSYTEPEVEAEDSDDSEKLTMEVDQIESENENDDVDNLTNTKLGLENTDQEENIEQINAEPQIQIAGPDISIIELQLEQPLDKFDPQLLLQKCLKATVPTCIYCNHARKIAVNGKQLGLHCIAEHRFAAVVNSITAEELIPESFVNKIKDSFADLESVFFNLEASFSDEAVTFSHLFECCMEKFISKKLMVKHERRHWEPPEEEKPAAEVENCDEVKETEIEEQKIEPIEEGKVEEKPKPKIDVLDLPELNLSESDSSDSETDVSNKPIEEKEVNQIEEQMEEMPSKIIIQEDAIESSETSNKVAEVENTVIQNIWDNFKNYQASKEKLDTKLGEVEKAEYSLDIPIPPKKKIDASIIEVKPSLTMTESVDHDYCSPKIQAPVIETPTTETVAPVNDNENQKKESGSSSSDSNSDSDSSSCSCGSNCSCSSTSGSSSSTSESSGSDSSTEEGRKKQQARRQRRKERGKKLNKENGNKRATESETDEEFYDKAPQKLAKKILEEKRQQLLAIMGPNSVPNGSFIESTSRPPTPPAGVVGRRSSQTKEKIKIQETQEEKSERRAEAEIAQNQEYTTRMRDITFPSYYQYNQPPTVAPITLTLPRNSPIPNQSAATPPISGLLNADECQINSMAILVMRSMIKYLPHPPKWRKTELPQVPQSPLVVPPITIKTPQPPQPTVEPISIKTGTHLSDFKVQKPRPKPGFPSIRIGNPKQFEKDSATESNDSSSEEQSVTPKPAQPQLYCYCRCPYDEVSEMIGCDATDCAIEWFHFECVGIMVPPKGQWFCPDCRKGSSKGESCFKHKVIVKDQYFFVSFQLKV
ncbi:hypothetical protein NQ317_007589 [Molorchus minor]|uniref:PHD-type domain-containing protein n=1 Tax=Molorchus minor TaxID=1323400 RepID=A0ABQ9J8J6_9CUCU|nr:hypothetical protein NQ317_007589 [Molorchus minor]